MENRNINRNFKKEMDVAGQKNSEMIKQRTFRHIEEDDLIIEDNTIYEIDLDCYECLMQERKRHGRI